MDFKVGDKVRILGTDYTGKLGTIVSISDHEVFTVGVKLSLVISGKKTSGIRWFRPGEIEKV